MRLSEYKTFLTLTDSLYGSVKSYLNKEGVLYDKIVIIESHESFIVLKLIHRGKESLTHINLWSILEEKFCSRCSSNEKRV